MSPEEHKRRAAHGKKRAHHRKMAWDATKGIGVVSAVLFAAHQFVDLTAKLRAQTASSDTFARTIVAMQGDIAELSRLANRVPPIDRRVRGIERKLHIQEPYGPPAPADTVAVNERGPSPISVITAPLRWLGRILTQGGGK